MSSPESQKPMQSGSIAAQKFWQFGLFCGNFGQDSHGFVKEFPPSFALLCRESLKIKIYCFLPKFTQKLIKLYWIISTQKNGLLKSFQKNFFCWKIFTKLRFVVGKFLQKTNCVGKFPQKIALWESFHNKFNSGNTKFLL